MQKKISTDELVMLLILCRTARQKADTMMKHLLDGMEKKLGPLHKIQTQYPTKTLEDLILEFVEDDSKKLSDILCILEEEDNA